MNIEGIVEQDVSFHPNEDVDIAPFMVTFSYIFAHNK